MNRPQLSLLVLRTPEPKALLPFYEALGLEFVEEQHGNGPLHFSSTLGEFVLEIYPLKAGMSDENLNTPMLGFRVDSLDETLEKLRAAGAKIGGEPKVSEWGRWCNAFDFDGRTVQITER
ncbi:glyoxalase/bleomycin resistance/extradiol dioxygenase family protein [bacterium]|nr:MAG: glyoxalase/bleomycin resistance/extradiol dioxygenase family protein [bacterium]